MTNVEIRGILYPIRMDLYAMEILDEGGDAQAVIEKFGKRQNVREIRTLFAAMANSARNYLGEKEDVTGKELLHCTMAELQKVTRGINEEMALSMRVETAMGNRGDDQHHDIYLEQIEAEEAKNAETGEG